MISTVLTFRKKIFYKCLLILISFVIVLVAGEVVVRIWVAFSNRIPLTVSNAHTGWVLSPNLRNRLRVEPGGQFVISTNKDGHRLTAPVEQVPPETTPVVILVGDSFVQGVGVNDNETFGWLLARDTPWTIVNLGVLGYGTDQQLLSLKGYLKAHPNLAVRDIVVFVFDNDFVDVQTKYEHWLGRSRPHFRVVNGRLEPENYNLTLSDKLMDFSYFYWFFNSKRGFLFAAPSQEPGNGVEVVIASLNEMQDIAAQRGAHFHVLVHDRLRNPESFHHPIWNDYIHRPEVINITEYLRASNNLDSVGYDGLHWSAEGHRRVATFLKEKLSNQDTAH